MEKLYITYKKIHKLIRKISEDIKKDNWQPDCMVAISAGGFVPSRILRNYFNIDIYIVGLKRYAGENEIHDTPVKIQWIDEVEKKIAGKKILLVDEIDDTRVTLSYCTEELLKHLPREIRIAVLHKKNKPKDALFPTQITNIYYGDEIPDLWINYPWEAVDIEKHYEMCTREHNDE